MEQFLKKRRLETAEEMEDLRQPGGAAANSRHAASSRLPKQNEISLQVKVRQYCENNIALGLDWKSRLPLDWKSRLLFTFVYCLWGEAS